MKAKKGKSPGPCGTCVHFPICSKRAVKSAKPETDYCLWGTDSGLYMENVTKKRKEKK